MTKHNKYLSIEKVSLGRNVKFSVYINIYGCEIGDNTKIGAFVEIQKKAVIGKNCKISSHTFICSGVKIGNNCFIGHGVVFINDNYPQSVSLANRLETENEWNKRFVKTVIEDNVSIGSNCTVLGNIKIGRNSLLGAGSVVTKNIPAGQIWAGNPAKFIRKRSIK